MLSSGAHVSIGGYEFKIDKTIENHYVHRYYDLTAEKLAIEGSQGKEAYLPDNLYWSMDDWAGGEGQNIFNKDRYDRYCISGALNPRIRGQLTGRPNQSVRGYNTNISNSGDIRLMQANGTLFAAPPNAAMYRWDGAAWTQVSITNLCTGGTLSNTTWKYATSDLGTAYFAGGGAGNVRVARGTSWSTATIIANYSTGNANGGIYGLGIMDGCVYVWDGSELAQFTPDPDVCTYNAEVVYSGGDLLNTNIKAGCFHSENSIVFWTAVGDTARIYEYKNGAGRPIWTAPVGFTMRDACYNNGIIYIVGHWGAAGEGWGALYGISMDSYASSALCTIRGADVDGAVSGCDPQQVAPSYGNSILIAGGSSGCAFIYDTETDALSILDDLNNDVNFAAGVDQVSGVATVGEVRYVMLDHSSGYNTLFGYDDDYVGERQAYLDGADANLVAAPDFSVTSAMWDMNFPAEIKSLQGFKVAFKPLVSGQTLTVSYRTQQGGAWTDLPVINNSTEGADVGRVFLQVSTPGSVIKFYTLQFKVKFQSDSGVLAPILYAITAESKLVNRREEWELTVRLKDEQSRERPSDRQVLGSTLRDWLLSVLPEGSAVTLLDGYRYAGNDQYTTHEVTVKEISDNIFEPGEGAARVILVANTEAA